MGLTNWNPLTRLRPRIALVLLGGIAALALFMVDQSSRSLTHAYHEAGRSELQAIAATYDDGFRGVDLSQPDRLQRRVERLKANNRNLHKISISWHDARGQTLLVSAGHEHDSNGVKRDVTTARAARPSAGGPSAPIDAGEYGYRDVRAPEAHYGELNYPVRDGNAGKLVAALELHYDLKGLDAALQRDKRVIGVAATLAVLSLALLIALFIGHALLKPLDALRRATNRIRSGERDIRLDWNRSDEIGQLADDFDRMAEELQEAVKDPLTGLLNHRAFQERLAEELRGAERERYPLSLVALDIDDFKVVNDTWGHATGDDALRRLAEAIRADLRPSDICGRVGGDEFMIALPRSSAEATLHAVERVRASVSSSREGQPRRRVRVSAGIAEFPRHSLAQEELLHLADGAMYWAKSSGKNQTFVYSSDADMALSPEEAAERNLKAGLVNTVHALARAVDAKDGYTHSHSQRVACYAVALGQRLGLDGERVERLRTAGVLHDVGKIGISDSLLLSPRKLLPHEMEAMQRHSRLGRDIIAGAGMDDVATWVLHLHERFDGRGYPSALKGEDVPLESRILHCADALEAMTSSRVYRDALPLHVAVAELERGAGEQFDPSVTRALVELINSGALPVGEDEAAREEIASRTARLAGYTP